MYNFLVCHKGYTVTAIFIPTRHFAICDLIYIRKVYLRKYRAIAENTISFFEKAIDLLNYGSLLWEGPIKIGLFIFSCWCLIQIHVLNDYIHLCNSHHSVKSDHYWDVVVCSWWTGWTRCWGARLRCTAARTLAPRAAAARMLRVLCAPGGSRWRSHSPVRQRYGRPWQVISTWYKVFILLTLRALERKTFHLGLTSKISSLLQSTT